MIREKFKRIIEDNNSMLTPIVRGLFEDSLRCFDAGIYRQAYILVYQGFIQYLRRVLLDAAKPTGYDQGKWNVMQAKLKNEKEFDEEVVDRIKQKTNEKVTPPQYAVLDIPDEVRRDFEFWRNRRNDCAHYKDYDVNQSHVLAFYSMLNQYLFTISVEGGKTRLLNEFKDAIDTKKTSPNRSLQPLVDKIMSMVKPEEMNSFFNELYSNFYLNAEYRFFSLLNDILHGSNKQLKEYLIDYMAKECDYLIKFLDYFPQNVGLLISNGNAREFWHEKLETSDNRFALIANMLKVFLIDKDDIEECLEYSINKTYDKYSGSWGQLREEDINILINNGFLDALKKTIMTSDFTSREYTMACYKCGFFESFMQYMPISVEFVEVIIGIFSAVYYPYTWAKIYIKYMVDNGGKKSKVEEICKEKGWKIPECIKK